MATATKKRKQSKLGLLLQEKGLTQREFAEMLYNEYGFLIQPTNLNNYCTGVRPIVKLETARMFADVLGVTIDEIV